MVFSHLDHTKDRTPFLQGKIAVLPFLGSNCLEDTVKAFKVCFGIDLVRLDWDRPIDDSLVGILIPGGFSYGDYLRSGVLAAHSPAIVSLRNRLEEAPKGTTPNILGICNGFQILVESKILPGSLCHNATHLFVSKNISLKIATNKPNYYSEYFHKKQRTHLSLPIAHAEGRYLPDPQAGYEGLFYYDDQNPNGSTDALAGILSTDQKVLGMMPHPERAFAPYLGSEDGKWVLDAFLEKCFDDAT